MTKNPHYNTLKKMPPLHHKHPDQDYSAEKSDVLKWIMENCGCIIGEADTIYRSAQASKVITFDKETRLWTGNADWRSQLIARKVGKTETESSEVTCHPGLHACELVSATPVEEGLRVEVNIGGVLFSDLLTGGPRSEILEGLFKLRPDGFREIDPETLKDLKFRAKITIEYLSDE